MRKSARERRQRAMERTANAAEPTIGNNTVFDATDNGGSRIQHPDDAVPQGIQIAAAWSWRLVVIGVAVYAALHIFGRLQVVMVPLAISLLLSALLQPAVAWLRRHHVPSSLAAAFVLIAGIAAVSGILTAVVRAFINGIPDLANNVQDGIEQIRNWLREGPLNLSDRQLNQSLDAISDWVSENRDAFTSGAWDATTTATHVLAGLFMVLFATFFFMRDGRKIWTFLVRMLPRGAQAHVASAGDAVWRTLVSYVRATVAVAFIDAVGIGLAAALLHLPLWLPIAALVFLSSFVPIVGATLSGAVAVLVALVAEGPVDALLMLIAVIAVQQLEGHILQPLLLGRAVAIHPLAVIVAIAAGVVVAGIVGALIAVPIVAVLNTAIRHLSARRALAPSPPPDDEPQTQPA